MVIATVTSKGQITIPKQIRQRLNIKSKGDLIGFEITKQGVLIKHLDIKEAEEDFTPEEWKKLEKLANQKGKTFKTTKSAMRHLKRLM